MKKKLFLLLCALLTTVGMWAEWTDVTSTYITNANLKDVAPNSTTNGDLWPVYTQGRTGNTQHPRNWYLHTNGTTNHNGGGEFFECWAANQGVKRWTLFQDIATLPAGTYKLTGQYSTNENRGIIKTVAITPHHSYFSPGITSSNWGSWGSESVEFTIYEASTVRVGMISTNFAQNHGFTLETTGAKQLLADVISEASALSISTAAAQAIYDDAGSDDAAYRSAAKTLHDAIVADNMENASESSPVDVTDYISNPSFEGVGSASAYTNANHAVTEWTYCNSSDKGAYSATNNNHLITDDANGNDAFYYVNFWNGVSDFYIKQTLKDLPRGKYKLTALYASEGTDKTGTLSMGTAESTITSTADKTRFVEGNVTYVLLEDGDVEIKLRSNTWFKADDFKLSYLGVNNKDYLSAEITKANATYNSGANVGAGVFQIPAAAGTAFAEAISAAQAVYDKGSATTGEISTAINNLRTAEETYANTTLNAPEVGKRYCIVVATEGHPKNGLAVGIVLGATGANNPTGYTINTSNTTNQSVAFTQVSGNSYNINFETAAGTTYLTYGTENGSAAGWKDSQIQATTVTLNKGNFTIAATNKANVFNIYNIHTNSTIACQNNDSGSLYTETGNADFTLVEATAANMAVNSTAKWGTFCAPFDVAIPDDVDAYTCESATDGKLNLDPVATKIPANTPVILNAESGLASTTFYGKKVANATNDLITEGLLVGNVSTSTKDVPSNGSAYLLQLHDNKVGFYKANGTGYLIGNNRCYLLGESLFDAREAFFFEDDATAISALEAAKAEDGALKDGKYIIDNKIVIVKNGVKYGANGQKLN